MVQKETKILQKEQQQEQQPDVVDVMLLFSLSRFVSVFHHQAQKRTATTKSIMVCFLLLRRADKRHAVQ